MGDWLNLDDKAPGRYHIIKTGNLFNISGASFWGNVEWLRKNEDVASAYIAELLKSFRMAHANPKILEPVVAKYLPDMPKNIIAPAIKAYLEIVRAWPQNGGDTSILDDTVKFFTANGELKTPVNTKEIVDSKILSSALAKVGRISGTR
jgi:ABC-type nitrate/sulfonate/bicarbonate transport system substrate-binding protein